MNENQQFIENVFFNKNNHFRFEMTNYWDRNINTKIDPEQSSNVIKMVTKIKNNYYNYQRLFDYIIQMKTSNLDVNKNNSPLFEMIETRAMGERVQITYNTDIYAMLVSFTQKDEINNIDEAFHNIFCNENKLTVKSLVQLLDFIHKVYESNKINITSNPNKTLNKYHNVGYFDDNKFFKNIESWNISEYTTSFIYGEIVDIYNDDILMFFATMHTMFEVFCFDILVNVVTNETSEEITENFSYFFESVFVRANEIATTDCTNNNNNIIPTFNDFRRYLYSEIAINKNKPQMYDILYFKMMFIENQTAQELRDFLGQYNLTNTRTYFVIDRNMKILKKMTVSINNILKEIVKLNNKKAQFIQDKIEHTNFMDFKLEDTLQLRVIK